MKTILLSIQPKHLLNILNGDKTLELRKTVPKDYVGWVYLYCTKDGDLLVDNTTWINFLIKGGFVKKDYTESPRFHTFKKLEEYMFGTVRNTKIVARFWFDEYDTYYLYTDLAEYNIMYADFDKLCLDYREVENYGKGKDLYAWHIKKLEIFDIPLSLNDFGIKKAPQSWQYVYIRKD